MKTVPILRLIFGIILFFHVIAASSQSNQPDSSIVVDMVTHRYPELKGYVGLVVPIYTLSIDGNTLNGEDNFVIGNPWGINIWKSQRFGFSFEFTPFLKFNSQESKMSNIMFHPGVLYRIGHEYTLIGRVAYETSGRYGFTPIINKVLVRTPTNTFFVAGLLPVRFGNNHAPSVTVAVQFGIGF